MDLFDLGTGGFQATRMRAQRGTSEWVEDPTAKGVSMARHLVHNRMRLLLAKRAVVKENCKFD
jgi:hypothetical protein